MTYIEPFLGSGIVFLNLDFRFVEYHLNDIQPQLALFFRNYDKITVERIRDRWEWEEKNFDVIHSKEGFYQYRDLFNSGECVADADRTIDFITLANTCLNNIVQFKDGNFTGTFGVRGYREGYRGNITQILLAIQRCEITHPIMFNKDALSVLTDTKNTKNRFMFIDPPYYLKDDLWNWKETDTAKIIDHLLDNDGHFIYTDIANNNRQVERLIAAGCSYQLCGKMRGFTVAKRQKRQITEIFVYR
jgi:site-specific DNA-adenine methylase